MTPESMPGGGGCPVIDDDLFSDDELANPYPTYTRLRNLGPVLWMPQHEVYVLPRYAEVRETLRDWHTFSSAQGVGLSPNANAKSRDGILTSDPPHHDTLRAVLTSHLRASEIEHHRAFLAGRAEALVESLVAAGRFCAVEDLAKPYSLGVVADLVGLPEDEREHLIDRASAAFNTFGPDDERHLASRPLTRDLLAYCADVAVPGRLTPDGWGQDIYDAGRDGRLASRDCPGLMMAYVWAGMDTTVNALSALVTLFADHPDQWTMLRSDRSLVVGAVNEVLRIEPPVQRFTRFTTVDTQVAGVTIPAGSRVLVLFGSANRDEGHYPEPDRFDITRNPADHLSFGRGIHRCVGAPLALQELYAVVQAFADRVSGFRLVERVQRRNHALHGLERAVVDIRP